MPWAHRAEQQGLPYARRLAAGECEAALTINAVNDKDAGTTFKQVNADSLGSRPLKLPHEHCWSLPPMRNTRRQACRFDEPVPAERGMDMIAHEFVAVTAHLVRLA